MSDDAASSSEPFDLDRLKELIELMEKHGLSEVNLRRGDERWQLRRGAHDVPQLLPPNPYAAAMIPPPPMGAPAPVGESKSTEAPDNSIEIKSPTVGTFYAAPTPEDPAFVKVGSKIQPETVVCIVEAMKVFNQIPAEVNGTIIETLVNNGDSVEFGQALFRVKPG